MSDYILLAGRILYSLPLIMMGSFHFLNFNGMAAFAGGKGLPLPGVSVIVSGLALIVGAVMILVGFRGKIGAWMVAGFLLATAFLMHNFWGIADQMQAQTEMGNFLRNIIMCGAALMITQTGTGPYSVDNLNR